jgi:hypothetical protein
MEHAEHEIDATDSAGLTDVMLPNQLLPNQFFGAMGSSGPCSEQRLMLAVLVDAINILQRWNRMGSARKRRTFADAARWVLMQGTNYPFSFDNVCDALNIDPKMLRQRLRGLARGQGATDRLGVGILRVKRLGRAQNMTATRVSRRRSNRLAGWIPD